MRRIVILNFAVGCILSAATPTLAGSSEEAAGVFATGKALLAKADFDGALQAFKKAATVDANNQEYAQQYAVLRQVVRMREDCPKEQDADQWLKMADALRTYYHNHRLYSEALPLDQKRHRRTQSAESAVLLAETQLALGMHSQASELLGNLSKELISPRTRVLHGLALARAGRIKEATKLAEQLPPTEDSVGPRYHYDLARIHVLAGDSMRAFDSLTQSFELTPPSKLDAFRSEVVKCEEFGLFRHSVEFARALETPSKVEESGCSKGPACGQCPKRAQCGAKNAEGD